MKINIQYFIFLLLIVNSNSSAQNYLFNFSSNGKRVCLVEAQVNLSTPSVTIKFLDYQDNLNSASDIYRRQLYGTGLNWTKVASALPAKTKEWVDTKVFLGEVWEYQIKRANTWNYLSQSYDATGYTIGSLFKDNSSYQGQMILLVADNIVSGLDIKYKRLKRELTGDGWYVNELVVPKATGWNSGSSVVNIKNQITTIYNNAPANDKPKVIFILGHVAMPRSGSGTVESPDAHPENKGAHGIDGYYADIDGTYTDNATFNPGGLASTLSVNLPGDYKWDQDFFASDLEMTFGRVDFENISDYTASEVSLISNYLDKLSNYKNVLSGFDMGDKSAFYTGYDNSNDGTYRSLPNISKSINVYENTTGLPHPQWVKSNGPFKIYMQNISTPSINEWNTYGMDATVYTSDQSYWGFNDVPQNGGVYSRIRALLASNTKCLVTLWTSTGVNIFYQGCTGDPLGFAFREITNHNQINKNIEKPQQEWDDKDCWNRTVFSYNGDPTLRLYQVKPPSNLEIKDNNGKATLTWTASADPKIVGYHIYKSSSELGKYSRITSTPVVSINYIDENYQKNNWYMVRAVKRMESGCGQFLQASLGTFAQGSFSLSISNLDSENNISIIQNSGNSNITVSVAKEIRSLEIFNMNGKTVYLKTDLHSNNITIDISYFKSGIYLLKIKSAHTILSKKIVI